MKYLILMTMVVIGLGCKKPEESGLSSQAETGSDFLWCKVNGAPHLYKGKPTMLHHDGVHVYQLKFADSSSTIEVFADNSRSYSDAIDMHINVTNEIAHVPLTNNKYKIVDNHPYRYSQYIDSSYQTYWVDSSRSNMIFTSFDNNIAAGTFEYHGFNKDSDTVHITEGFFNIVRE